MTEQTARRIGLVALLLAGSQLLSRVLGFARDAAIAGLIGRGADTDAYNAAFQIPDLMFHLLAGGALSIAFIPLYQRARSQGGAEAAERFLATVLGTISALALVATALLFVFAEPLVALQFPELPPEVQALTVRLTRIVLPAQIAFITGGVLRGALMAEGRFGSQAAAPLVYNLAIIAGGLVGRDLGVEGFAWGALFGAFAGNLGTALWEARGRHSLGFRVAPFDAAFRRYFTVALPLMLGATLITVDEWYGRWFGGLLGTGAIATLAFARRVMQVPVGLVGQSVATASLPTLARLADSQAGDELQRTVLRTLQASLALSVLLGAAAVAFADPIVRFVYVRGAFTLADAAPVAAALRLLALGIPAWVVQTLAVRPFYARADMWSPMLLGTGVAVLAIPLYWRLGAQQGVEGLAVAGSLAITANAVATLALARRLHGTPDLLPLLGTLARALAACAPAAGIACLAGDIIAVRSGGGGTSGALLELAVGGALYAALALPLAYAFGDAATRDALGHVLGRVRARLRRGRRTSPS